MFLLGRRALLVSISTLGLCLGAARDAGATLGGDVASIAANAQHLGATGARVTEQVQKLASGERHDLVLPSGVVIRQYVSPSGAVYGVSWSGPRIPDLRELLGARFADLADRKGTRHGGRHAMTMTGTDLVVQSSGHARSFSGRAWIPSLVPAGVKPEVSLGGSR
jgi:hypothetical protein